MRCSQTTYDYGFLLLDDQSELLRVVIAVFLEYLCQNVGSL